MYRVLEAIVFSLCHVNLYVLLLLLWWVVVRTFRLDGVSPAWSFQVALFDKFHTSSKKVCVWSTLPRVTSVCLKAVSHQQWCLLWWVVVRTFRLDGVSPAWSLQVALFLAEFVTSVHVDQYHVRLYIGQHISTHVSIHVSSILVVSISTLCVTQWRYWYGIGLAIYRSRVRVLAGHHRLVALGKLPTPVCLCHQQYTSQGGDLFGLKSRPNRRSGGK